MMLCQSQDDVSVFGVAIVTVAKGVQALVLALATGPPLT